MDSNKFSAQVERLGVVETGRRRPSRLNRDLSGSHGNKKYSFEELIAGTTPATRSIHWWLFLTRLQVI